MYGVVLGISPIEVLNSIPCVSGGFQEVLKYYSVRQMGLLNWRVNSIKARLVRCKGLVERQSLHVLLGKQVHALDSSGTRNHM